VDRVLLVGEGPQPVEDRVVIHLSLLASSGIARVAMLQTTSERPWRNPPMPDEPEPTPLVVLVPSAEGEQAMAADPLIHAIAYQIGTEPGAEHEEARAIVVGYGRVDETAAFMAGLPSLELVQTLNAGFEQWLGRVPAGVAISNARGAHGRATAEWVVAILLAHLRDLVAFAATQAEGRWDARFVGTLDGARVAVLGAGDIAGHVRAMLEPFNATVTLVGRTARDGVVDLDRYRRIHGEQDVIVLALPVSDDTVRMVDGPFLAGMKDGAILVNAGRGALVDTDALIAATADGRIHALVDVTDPEPLPDGHPMWSAPGITITPHVAGATAGIWDRAWQVAATQLGAYARGQRPANLVIDGS
jgi:phosphoglycerate dehydrogenase-like enzyme